MHPIEHPPNGDGGAWTRALEAALAAPTPEDALAAALEALAPRTGAAGAAFVEPAAGRIRAAWNWEETALAATLAHHDVATLVRAAAGHGADEPTRGLIALDATGGEGDAVLLLRLPAGADAGRAYPDHARGLAALGALLLQRERAAEEARRARQARDHFLVAIHHELRTPATALMLEAGLLQTGLLGELPERLQRSVARLETQVDELVRVIYRVLDLARLEAGTELPRGDLLDPRQTIVELARRVEPSAERKGIHLSLFLPKQLPLIQTDAERFRRVVLHLLANALKYTDAGRIQVRVERNVRGGRPGRRETLLVIRVVDTGRGIPPAELERIFEPFAQVEEGARSDSSKRGVGLGLPLARKLARSLGGDVSVESAPGEGTIATFWVPYTPPHTG